MSLFTRQGRGRTLLLLTAVLAVGSVCWLGCGDDNGTNPDEGGGVVKGTFTDSRNGQTYKTVKIGSKTWMAENLNYDTADGTLSWCYKNSPDSCAKYGRLYTWNAAKTVCPIGWKLPDTADFNMLMRAVGGIYTVSEYIGVFDTSYYWKNSGKKLKSKSGWSEKVLCDDDNSNCHRGYNGTDDYGFSALPGGCYFCFGHGFSGIGLFGFWWAENYNYSMDYSSDDIYSGSEPPGAVGGFEVGLSVRCVAD